MQNKLKILSLGWGVQSWTLAAMVALGELPPIDAAVHSDTGFERQATYDFAAEFGDWLQARGVNVVTLPPSKRAREMKTEHGIVQIPAFTFGHYLKSDCDEDYEDCAEVTLVTLAKKSGVGRLNRQCTKDWKVFPIKRFVSGELARRGWKKTPGIVDMWLGITTDEYIRMKDSRVQYIRHVYPLIDKRMSRNDCLIWLERHGLPIPPKSSCTFCPFHSPATWRRMKQVGGADWQEAVEVDKLIRDRRPPGKVYLIRDCIPLEDIQIPEDHGYTQGAFLEDDTTCDSGYCFM